MYVSSYLGIHTDGELQEFLLAINSKVQTERAVYAVRNIKSDCLHFLVVRPLVTVPSGHLGP